MPEELKAAAAEAHQKLVEEYELPSSDPSPEAPAPSRDDKGRFLPKEVGTPAPAAEQPATQSAAPQSAHDPFFTRLAQSVGMSDAEIAEHTPDQLRAVIARETRNLQKERERVRAETPRAPAGTTEEPPLATVASRAEKPEAKAGKLELPKEIRESMYPEVVAHFDAVAAMAARLEKLEAMVPGLQHTLQDLANQPVYQRIDNVFAKNPERYGKGTREQIARESPEAVRRGEIVRLADQLRSADRNLSIEAAVEKADSIMYGGSQTQEPRNPTAPQTPREQEWAAGAVARPTQQIPAEEPKGVRRAKQKLAEQMGVSANGLGTEEYRDLPE